MSKCCGECATGECGNLDRIEALERELAEAKDAAIKDRAALYGALEDAQTQRLRESDANTDLARANRALLQERDEAHAELQDAVSRYHALAAKWDLSKSQLDEAHAAIRALRKASSDNLFTLRDRNNHGIVLIWVNEQLNEAWARLAVVEREHAPAIRRAGLPERADGGHEIPR